MPHTQHGEIKCPNCQYSFDVERVLWAQAQARAKQDFEIKHAELAQAQKEFELKKQRENEIFLDKLDKALQKEKGAWQQKFETEKNAELEALKRENEQRKKEAQAQREKEIQLLQQQSDLKEQIAKADFEAQKKLHEERDRIAQNAVEKEAQKWVLKEMEWKKDNDEKKRLIDELKRKAEQGSMQTQGEVQELVLEELLQKLFPYDRIEKTTKGTRGADVLQNVCNELQQNCGKIIYESKNTKTFQKEWIEKLKADQFSAGAQIAILVTAVFPADMKHYGEREGIWICSLQDVGALATIWRKVLIEMHHLKTIEQGKEDKMQQLYQYLVGGAFKQRVEHIVQTFIAMQTGLQKEKIAMQKIWKEREAQIEKVIVNTIDMHTSIRSIGGKQIASIGALELDEGATDDGEEV